jgi:hypothetical protein
MAKQKVQPVVLERGGERLPLKPETWANILLFLSKRGLALSRPHYNLLGRNVAVSDQEAAAIASSGEEAFNQAMNDPATEYPMPCDMKRFGDVIVFCQQGAFRVTR